MQKSDFMRQKWYSTCILAHLTFLSEPGTKNGAAGVYFMRDVPQDGKPISLNGNIFVVCGILKLVSASAAKTK